MKRLLFLLLLIPFFCSAEVLVLFGATGDLAQRKLIPALEELQENFQVVGIGRREFKMPAGMAYLQGDFDDADLYQEIAKIKGDKLFYLATAPSQFIKIVKRLHAAGLLEKPSKVLIEKPLGRDFESGLKMKKELLALLKPEQIYLIDHYLGYAAVQDIAKIRDLERLNSDCVESVTITFSEEIGIGTRGALWEETGYLRDVIQNHAMQLLMLLAMESEKAEVLKAVRIVDAVRGQYIGYRQEKNVAPDSPVETFAAIKLYIDNERWRGCPFILKGGKRLKEKYTEIEVTFKTGEKWTYRIHPDSAYSAILLAALKEDRSYFTNFEEHLLSWTLLTPILNHWSLHPPHDFPNYASGTEGPSTFGENDEKNDHGSFSDDAMRLCEF